MDDVTEEDIALLSSETSSQWLKLPEDTSMNGLPVYLKIASSPKTSRLVVLLTDLRSGVWCEVFSELRALHVRIRVSARDVNSTSESQQSQSQSQISDLKAEEAASQLFQELSDYAKSANQKADLTIKSDAEVEVLLHLPSLSFKLRLDKLSQATSHVLLYDLMVSPLIGIAQAIVSAGVTKLEEHPHTIDEAVKKPIVIDDILLAAMQRFGQAAAGVAKDQRHTIAGLAQAPDQASKEDAPPDKTKHARSDASDPDATMDSPPPQKTVNKRSRSPSNPKSPSPAQERRQSKGKGKVKGDVDLDGSATEESSDEKEVAAPAEDEEEQVHKPSSKAGKRQRVASPSSEEDQRVSEPPPPSKAESPDPPKPSKPKKAPKAESSQASQAPPKSTPQVPVLRWPAAGRGGPAKRGRGGMNWSNFG